VPAWRSHAGRQSALKRVTSRHIFIAATIAAIASAGCRQEPEQREGTAATPVYNKQSGRLEELLSDKNGDGKIDTRAHMEGVRVKYIEIDLNADERPDRWEYYVPASRTGGVAGLQESVLERVEVATQFNGKIMRREFYENGIISRTEEDTDFDGRIDKWETYEAGQLARVELDLDGKGFASRRLVYRADGAFDHVEQDSDGDGRFDVVAMPKKGGDGR
jgi:hypothetical protein